MKGLPQVFTPMLATVAAEPFDSEDHLFEVKWDGVRSLCFVEDGGTRLYARSRREVTHQYPEFGDLHSRLRVGNAVIDGEIVALDDAGRPSFELLQQRIAASRPSDVRRCVERIGLDLICFDVVFIDGEWIAGEPLQSRLDRLPEVLSFGERVLRSEAIPEHGRALFDAAQERRLEGIVAKRRMSTYQPGRRSRDWIKIKVIQSLDVVIGGWSVGGGSRGSSFGALLVGVYEGEALRYIGSVGTGFKDKTLTELRAQLRSLESEVSPFSEKIAIPRGRVRFVRPELVCEVEYRELTRGFRLRAPSFKRLRTDVEPRGCVGPG